MKAHITYYTLEMSQMPVARIAGKKMREPLPLLGAQNGHEVIEAIDGASSVTVNASTLARIRVDSDCWVRIGGEAVADQCEIWEARDIEVRYVRSGQTISVLPR